MCGARRKCESLLLVGIARSVGASFSAMPAGVGLKGMHRIQMRLSLEQVNYGGGDTWRIPLLGAAEAAGCALPL